MPSLASWERAQREQLDALQANGAERAMLSRLLETSCLLELSKLASSKLDFATYLQMAVDALAQFAPADACVIRLRIEGLPEMRSGFGSAPSDEQLLFDAAAADELGLIDGDQTHVVYLGDRPVGFLYLEMTPGIELSPDFTARAAAEISSGLEAVVERERLRRQAAASWATRLAASIDERTDVEQLEELAHALASLPNAVGANLTLECDLVAFPVSVSAGTVGVEAPVRRRLSDGGTVEVSVTWATGPRDQDLSIFEDVLETLVTSLERAQQVRRLLAAVETDPLTSIGNRRRVDRALRAALNRAERYDEPVAVVLLDLDRFKAVNDRLGHDVGDEILRRFAQMLEHQARAYDTVARVGGEEFVVVCPTTDAVGARTLAERLRSLTPEVGADLLPDGWKQTVSVGIAVYPDVEGDGPKLLRAADAALYEAKDGGRDRVEMADRR